MQFDYFAASLGSSRLSWVVPWTGQFISAAYSFIYLTGCRSIRPPWPLVIQAMAVLNYWVALDGGWWAALFILSSLTVSICSPFFWGVLGAMLRPDATLAGLLFICKWDKKRTKMNKTIITQFSLFLSTNTRPTKYKFSWGLNYERNGPPTCSAPDVRIHVDCRTAIIWFISMPSTRAFATRRVHCKWINYHILSIFMLRYTLHKSLDQLTLFVCDNQWLHIQFVSEEEFRKIRKFCAII